MCTLNLRGSDPPIGEVFTASLVTGVGKQNAIRIQKQIFLVHNVIQYYLDSTQRISFWDNFTAYRLHIGQDLVQANVDITLNIVSSGIWYLMSTW